MSSDENKLTKEQILSWVAGKPRFAGLNSMFGSAAGAALLGAPVNVSSDEAQSSPAMQTSVISSKMGWRASQPVGR